MAYEKGNGKTAVIALGGNALGNTPQEQLELVQNTAKHIVDMIQDGTNVVVSHGNGPQVGMINNAFAYAAANDDKTPDMPFPEAGAMSQGYIGYQLSQAILNDLKSRDIMRSTACIVTQTVVDEDDPAFQNPTKPVGAFMDEETAKAKAEAMGITVKEDAGRGWRQVVASPIPKRIVEFDAVRDLVEDGYVVVSTGGGGVPVFETENGYVGTPAVIDKDRSSALMAAELGGHEGAGAVLVDDRGGSDVAVLGLEDRHPAAAGGHDHVAVLHQVAHGVELHDALGDRGGDHLAPAAAGVLLDGDAHGLGLGLGGLLVHERAHGLGGVLERGVVLVDDGLGHDAGGRAHDVAGLQVVQDGLGQLVADVALGHGAGLGEGHVRGLVVVGRRVGEGVVDHADLRAVAVGDDDVGAVLDHVHDVLGGVLHELELLLRGVAEGVAAQGDDSGLAVALFVSHRFHLNLSVNQPISLLGCM